MIISIMNQKGGVGKTTTAIHLAVALARLGKKILLIDLDPQAHATSTMRIESPQRPISDIFSNREANIAQAIIPTHIENLHIVPSSIRLAKQSENLYGVRYAEELLQEKINPIAKKYDHVLIDCPPNLGILAFNAAVCSDFFIVPCNVSRTPLDGMNDLIETIKIAKRDEQFSRYKILLTMFDVREKIVNNTILDALAESKMPLFKTRIPRSTEIKKAEVVRSNVFDYKPGSKAALGYQNLIKEILCPN